MSLGDIKNRLYEKGENDVSSENDSSGSNTAQARFEQSGLELETEKIKNANPAVADEWGEKPGLGIKQKKIIKIGMIIAGSILAIFLIFFGIYEYRQLSFKEEKVEVAVNGPNEGESGRALVFEIDYKNSNRTTLKDAVLRINYPENFKPEGNLDFTEDGLTTGIFKLGEVKGQSTGKVIFSGKANNPKGTLIYILAGLYYTPSNFNSQFIAKNQIAVSITASPINLEILAPQNISDGDSIDYLISYKNVGSDDFENMKITAEYPEGFSFSRAVPGSSEGNNIWYVGRLSGGQEGKIVVSGKLEGSKNEIRPVKAAIGSFSQGQFIAYNESKAETKIAASPLFIMQAVNGVEKFNAKAGDRLSFDIRYGNEGGVGLKDVIITEQINSPVLDYETLDLVKGAFDLDTKTITWKASDYPDLGLLEPGKGGAIKFTIKVKNNIPVSGAADKNFVISAISKIDSPDIATPIEMNKIIAGNRIDIRLNSKIILDVKGFYGDPALPNSGPIPPKVGEETTYNIHWIVTNVSNDISGAKVESVLPTGVTLTGKGYPENLNIKYNDRSNSIIWEIGNIAAGTGVLNSPLEAVFQVKIKPAPNQAGRAADLLGSSVFAAKDLFTNDDLSLTAPEKTTTLPEDASIGTAYRIVN